MSRIPIAHLALVVIAVSFAGCSAEAGPGTARVEQLPNGAPAYVYEGLDVEPRLLATELRIGVADGAEEYMFGDIRSVDVDAEGTIYVLDGQAMEVRVFDREGVYQRTIARRGMGPGEITRGNGLQLGADTTLWIQDHGRYSVTAIALDGSGEVATAPMPVRRYGYVWDGGVDAAGRIWKPNSRVKDPDAPMMPESTGPIESENIGMLVRHDLLTSEQDTLELSTFNSATYAVVRSNGYAMYGVPFTPGWKVRVARSGDIWHASTAAYRLAKLSPSGDTLLVVQVNRSADPVTEEDRRELRERMAQGSEENAMVGNEMSALLPELKPAFLGFHLDYEGRVWVRTGSDGEAPAAYDVFEPDGTFLTSVQLEDATSPFFNPVIRAGRVYGIATDSLGAPVVFRSAGL